MGNYLYGLELPSRRLLGRVVRVEKVDGRPEGKTSYEVDAIDVLNRTLGNELADAPVAAFALLRISSDRIAHMAARYCLRLTFCSKLRGLAAKVTPPPTKIGAVSAP